MEGMVWYEKYKTRPATERFYEIFGGRFFVESEGGSLYYDPRNGNAEIKITDNENKFWTKVLQSIEKRKNLFL